MPLTFSSGAFFSYRSSMNLREAIIRTLKKLNKLENGRKRCALVNTATTSAQFGDRAQDHLDSDCAGLAGRGRRLALGRSRMFLETDSSLRTRRYLDEVVADSGEADLSAKAAFGSSVFEESAL